MSVYNPPPPPFYCPGGYSKGTTFTINLQTPSLDRILVCLVPGGAGKEIERYLKG